MKKRGVVERRDEATELSDEDDDEERRGKDNGKRKRGFG